MQNTFRLSDQLKRSNQFNFVDINLFFSRKTNCEYGPFNCTDHVTTRLIKTAMSCGCHLLLNGKCKSEKFKNIKNVSTWSEDLLESEISVLGRKHGLPGELTMKLVSIL